MTQLILIRGIPGSGKTTLAKQLVEGIFEEGSFVNLPAIHLEADQFFVGEDGVYRWDGMKIGEAHEYCQWETRRALAAGRTVIVSNTFTTIKELRPYFEMIQKYDKNPIVYHVQSTFKSVHDVPQKSLDAMKARFAYDISELFI